MLKITITGIEKVAKNIQRFGEFGARAVEKALYQEGEEIMTESKKIVPVKTGTLRASGRTNFPVRAGTRVTVELAYGGAAAPYALYVHEGTSRMAPRKYLELPLLEHESKMLRSFGEKLSAELGTFHAS